MPLTVASVLFGLLLGPGEPVVSRLEPAPRAHAVLAAHVVARTLCPAQALWRVHSHLGADRCWHRFPGTRVETSDAIPQELSTGRAVNWEDVLAVVRPKGRRLGWGDIESWVRAVRSVSRPRIFQSVRVTVTYRRPMGARLGIIVDF